MPHCLLPMKAMPAMRNNFWSASDLCAWENDFQKLIMSGDFEQRS